MGSHPDSIGGIRVEILNQYGGGPSPVDAACGVPMVACQLHQVLSDDAIVEMRVGRVPGEVGVARCEVIH